ncbi:hypothetical protein ZOSMA_10G01310 [Zostera marina]|uniref:FAF domain-containing protein n=1 Tax=Zostera marina TaxID=29655 RepID=A0A0K9Q5P0_ZOSMR|nr:hypothetical protein ZOSMA_10G01310 [Zostera marina]
MSTMIVLLPAEAPILSDERMKNTEDGLLRPHYVHPMVRKSPRFLSKRSLEICTESLGSETGSTGYIEDDYFSSDSDEEDDGETLLLLDGGNNSNSSLHGELQMVNYYQSSQLRPFPPPLPSITRRDGPCVHMRSHRRDGRLVIEAVEVPPRNYLHCRRHDGKLTLTVVETTFNEIYSADIPTPSIAESEVEVVDRGILVEVKVSRQGWKKVQKSSLVINKFVGGINPLDHLNINFKDAVTGHSDYAATMMTKKKKLVFASKKLMNRQTLLHQVRKCGHHRRSLFIWEPCCIAST